MFDTLVAGLAEYEVVLEPDENTPEWWAGAPSVVRAPDGTFYLACRMREGRSPKGRRGYEIRILRSSDGRRFEPVNRLLREAAHVPGFERPALVLDPQSGLFRLYGCAGLEGGWAVLRFEDVSSPAEFDAGTARPVLSAANTRDVFPQVEGYKDPFVIWLRDRWHMFVIGYDRVERVYHFESEDGEVWRPVMPCPVMPNAGWHNFYTRPACVLPLVIGCLFVYEGSDVSWYDPVYNIATGLAYSPDLRTMVDLTPEAPLLRSTTPGDYHTWRYSHWLQAENRIYVYFEGARPNNTNEIRLAILSSGTV